MKLVVERWKSVASGMAALGLVVCAAVFARATPLMASPAEVSGEGHRLLNELAQISIDPQNTFKIREINIDRDAIHITLHRGTLAFFTPVRQRVTGAVFVGEGEILVIPPTKIEKFQLNRFTDSPVLTERFTSAVFRFTDGTFEEISRTVQEVSSPEPTTLDLKSTWDEAVRELSLNLNYRILQDLVTNHPHRLFHASLNGRTYGWFEAAYDDRAYEPVLVGRVTKENGVDYPDIWCSFQSSQPLNSPHPPRTDHLEQYDIAAVSIDAEIGEDAHLTATARLELQALTENESMLAFELSRGLKVTAVEGEDHHPLEFFQNSLLLASDIVQRGNDVVYVMLDHVPLGQESLRLDFRYSGDVITSLGNGIYFVGARGTWYPNHGISDAAIYHMKFRFPASKTLVATGTRISETIENSRKASEWDSEVPMGIAGFNYGEYLTKSQKVNGVDVAVYANKGLEEVVRNFQLRIDQLNAARMAAIQPSRPPRDMPPPPPPLEPPPIPQISTQTLLTNVIEDTAATLQFYENWFGPYPYRKLAVSQIPGRFGQGWPTLCYVSTLTFLTPQQQSGLGMSRDSQLLFSQLMRAHEIAHQWWGNQVFSRSYHDAWLIEGMANYAALLFTASKNPKEKEFQEILQHLKLRLLEKPKDNRTVESAGPIWLGWRLFSSKAPTGYRDIVYDKGAWIIHMLRMMMRDSEKESDDRFIGALKSFLVQYKDRPASTEDFKQILEKHMTPSMDFENNRRLDWFFDEWVYDVGIPEYQLKYSLSGSPEKSYTVSGRVEQSGVPPSFEMPVPIFAHYGSQTVQIGSVVVSGSQTTFRIKLPEAKPKPSKISLNDNDAVLCVVKSK